MRYFILLLLINTFNIYAGSPLLRELNLSYKGHALIVNKTHIDKNGVLWICSGDGLFIWRSGKLRLIVDRIVNNFSFISITETTDGKIAAGTENGELFICQGYTSYSSINLPENKNISIKSLTCDLDGQIWVGTNGNGIYVINNEGKVKHFLPKQYKYDGFVHCISSSKKGTIVFGTDDGLYYFDYSTNLGVVKHLNESFGLLDNIVLNICYQSVGKLCIGTQDKGVQIYDETKHNFSDLSLKQKGMVNTLCNIDGEIWAGFSDGRIEDYEFFGNFRRRDIHLDDFYEFNTIQQIVQTPFGNQLIVANNKLYITPGEWLERISYPDEVKGYKNKGIAMSGQRIYVAFENGLYYKTDTSDWTKVIVKDFNFNACSQILCVSEYIFISSLTQGIFCINKSGKVLAKFNSNLTSGQNNVFCISLFNNILYFGGIDGIGAIDIKQMKIIDIEYLKLTKGYYIYDIEFDDKGEMYFGTDSKGIGFYKNGTLKMILPGSEYEKKIVHVLDIGRDSKVWFSTMYYGLNSLENGKISNMHSPDLLSQYPLNTLIMDGYDNLLCISNDFMLIYNTVSKKEFELQNDFQFNGKGITNSNVCSDTNNVLIAASDYLYVFQPRRFSFLDKFKTKAVANYIFLNEISELKNEFKFNENHISFEMLFPYYFNMENVNYVYQLEGRDTFKQITSNSLITFQGLVPGKYKIRIKGILHNTASSGTEWFVHEFAVLKPWYSSWYFYIFMLLISISIIVFLYKFKYKNRILREEAKRQMLIQEVKILNAQVNPHFLFNSLNNLIHLIETSQTDAVNYTEYLSEFYRQAVNFKDELTIPMSEELNFAEVYIYLQNIRFSGLIDLRIDFESIQPVYIWIIPPMSVQILLENAVKHNIITKDKKLIIKIYRYNDFLIIENNRSPKRVIEKSTNSGLNFVAERYRYIFNQDIKVFSDQQVFKVELPLMKHNDEKVI